VGLNVATRHGSRDDAAHAVFLSGNGPLVAVLREALARDELERRKKEKVSATIFPATRGPSTSRSRAPRWSGSSPEPASGGERRSCL